MCGSADNTVLSTEQASGKSLINPKGVSDDGGDTTPDSISMSPAG